MKIYIDLEHYISFLSRESDEHYINCVHMLQCDLDIHFTFAKDELLKLKKDIKAKSDRLFNKLQTNRGKSSPIQWNAQTPTIQFDGTTISDLFSTIYFLSKNDDEYSELNVLFTKKGDEIKRLTNLYIEKRYIPSKQYSIRDMQDWSVIQQNSSPCTDIIIVDRYLFAIPEAFYDDNIFSILASLSHQVVNIQNIVVFTLPYYLYNDKPFGIRFDYIEKEIKQLIFNRTGKTPNVTFVELKKGTPYDKHDRYIITNYKCFASGDSFNYFEGKNLKTKGDWLMIHSLLDRDNLGIIMEYLGTLQEIIKNCSIRGDKKSNYLQF